MLEVKVLKDRAIIVFENTKKEMTKYEKERKQLYYYCKNAESVNLEEWEEFLNYFEQKIKESE